MPDRQSGVVSFFIHVTNLGRHACPVLPQKGAVFFAIRQNRASGPGSFKRTQVFWPKRSQPGVTRACAPVRNGAIRVRTLSTITESYDFVRSSAFTAASPRAVLSSRHAIKGRVNVELRTATLQIAALIVESVLNMKVAPFGCASALSSGGNGRHERLD